MLSAALNVAIELRIAEQVAAGRKSVSALAAGSGRALNEDALYRVLRALASVGIFSEVRPREFASTPPAEFLRGDVPWTLRELVRWLSEPLHFRVHAELMHSVETGRPSVEKVTGSPVFEFFPKNRELSELFNDAMTNFSRAIVPAVLEAYDFSGVNMLVDIAGGHGAVLTSILKQYPTMRGLLFDLDHVVAGAAPAIRAEGLDGRVQTASGDFFKAVPGGGDLYLMKHIIHDWDDERATLILKNIRRVLEGQPNGRVVLLESVLQPGNEPDLGKLIDLEMLTFPGGLERTADQFTALFTRAGFTLSRIVPTHSPVSVIEARPS